MSEEFGIYPNLYYIDVSRNNLYGYLSSYWGISSILVGLLMPHNNLYGIIPPQLQVLDLSANQLIGSFPDNFGNLKQLLKLYLNNNRLSGSIPLSLTIINISYNQLEGPLPNTKAFQNAPFDCLTNDKALCGNIIGLKNCSMILSKNAKRRKSRRILLESTIFPVLGGLLPSITVIGIFLISRLKKKIVDDDPKIPTKLFPIWSFDGKMMYQNIIEATKDFSSRHCVGVGGCGSDFKAEFEGHVVGIKKLHSLEGGSLVSILCNDEKAKEFEWNKRVNVVKGVANALSYMHHNISPPIVHRDISSKNILLDFKHEAHIADFGTGKILKPDSSNWVSLAGTFGYAAPVHDIFMKDMLDQRLSIPTGHVAEHVVAIAKLAFACIRPTPQLRPSIEQVSMQL
ncbi:putative LRR receptor-like serine/threonine-protein kinase [Abeliophyllum distichum]|uniref:non-specific serine/threonine protein kinase n=1 Tax=Abeliophyllum distichum TaxID=126358 RepID=A0ABD1Q5I4_9LAMI